MFPPIFSLQLSFERMKSFSLMLCLLLASASLVGQDTLYHEPFEGNPSFSLNTSDLGGATNGANRWLINDSYLGGSGSLTCLGFPFTFTVSDVVAQPAGISQAGGQYLHMCSADAQASGITNANYAVADGTCFLPESYFAAMTQSLDLSNYETVALSFWWLCGGSANAFGEVYYSFDNGSTWTLVPNAPTFSGQVATWTQTTLSDPMFDGQPQVRFGFRFVNNQALSGSDPGFAIDDLLVTGSRALSLSTDSVSRSSLCRAGDTLRVYYTVSGALSSGNRIVAELSDANGDFTNPVLLDSILTTSSGSLDVMLPSGLPVGTGYRVRVRSTMPPQTGSDNGSDLTLTPANLADSLSADPAFLCDPGNTLLTAAQAQGNLQWQAALSGAPFADLAGATTNPYTYGPVSDRTELRLIASGGACPADTSPSVVLTPVNLDFTATVVNGLAVQLVAQGNGVTNWLWDMGDGVTSLDSTLTHTYPEEGTYVVCLTAVTPDCTDSTCQTVTVTRVGLASSTWPVEVFPNPVARQLRVAWPGGRATLSLFDAQGRRVRHQPQVQSPYRWALDGLPTGAYWLSVQAGRRRFTTLLRKD